MNYSRKVISSSFVVSATLLFFMPSNHPVESPQDGSVLDLFERGTQREETRAQERSGRGGSSPSPATTRRRAASVATGPQTEEVGTQLHGIVDSRTQQTSSWQRSCSRITSNPFHGARPVLSRWVIPTFPQGATNTTNVDTTNFSHGSNSRLDTPGSGGNGGFSQ